MKLRNTTSISIKKNPEKYATEQKESGREDFIKENWQKEIIKTHRAFFQSAIRFYF